MPWWHEQHAGGEAPHSLSLVLRSVFPHHAAAPVLPLAVELALVERTVREAEQPLTVPQPVVPIAVVYLDFLFISRF